MKDYDTEFYQRGRADYAKGVRPLDAPWPEGCIEGDLWQKGWIDAARENGDFDYTIAPEQPFEMALKVADDRFWLMADGRPLDAAQLVVEPTPDGCTVTAVFQNVKIV